MSAIYKERVSNLIQSLIKSLALEIDLNIKVGGRPPTMANSEFLTNKEQGDWAEKLIRRAINQNELGLVAIQYGRSESLAAGDEGFEEFYASYQAELNELGKRPDILIFEKADFSDTNPDTSRDEVVSRAIAAIEVRSSSFLANQYAAYMEQRGATALDACMKIKREILGGELANLLREKNEELYRFLECANDESFKQLTFRRPSWSSSEQLRRLSELLGDLKSILASFTGEIT